MPATAVVPKVLLPVGTRPMLHWALEEALDAVTGGVIVVVSPHQPLVREYLEAVLDAAVRPAPADGGAEELRELGRRLGEVELRTVEQPEPAGVGDAFVRCRPITGTEDFAVLMPDNWFRGPRPCLAQMLPTFRRHGRATLALVRVGPEEAGRLGNVGGVRLEPLGGDGDTYRILSLQDKKGGTFQGATGGPELRGCGRYLVTPEFYEALEATGPPDDGEWDDVPAFQHLIAAGRVVGHRVEADHFDLGQPAGYAAATASLNAAGSGAAAR